MITAAFVVGVPAAVEESVATEAASLTVAAVLPDSPAAQAKIPVGARIVSVISGNDEDTNLTPTSFKSFTQIHGDTPLAITYRDGTEEVTVDVIPQVGLIEEDVQKSAIGVALTLVETVSKPVHIAAYDALITTGKALGAITVGIISLITDSFKGSADFSQVAGPIGIVSLVGDAAGFGLTSLMMFTAIISLNLAVINMFPFPALDGGRLLFVAIEAVMRRPINPVWVARLNTAGFLLLMALMIAVTYSDITKKFF